MNALLLLPINLRSGWRGPFAVRGFSGGKQLYRGAIAASLGASGKNICRQWSGSLGFGAGGDGGGVADGDDVAAFGDGDGVFGFRKKNRLGAKTLGACCYR